MKTRRKVIPALILLIVTTCSLMEAAETIRLQLRPTIGQKQAMRVTSKLTMSYKIGSQQQNVTNTKTFTLRLEATDITADRMASVKVTLEAIQERSEMQGKTLGEYDSTKLDKTGGALARHYSAFIGQSFTMRVSPRGDIVERGLDELFLAVAENLMEREDRMIREKLKDRAEQSIESTNERYGSREKRKLALKKQAEEFPMFGKNQMRHLLDNLFVLLPEKPVQRGSTWSRPVIVDVGAPMKMAGTYTLTSVENEACTIEAKAQRSLEEKPLVYQAGRTNVSNKLGGSYQATLRVARKTGCVLSKQQTTNLSGQIDRSTAGSDAKAQTMEVSMVIATTVETVE